MYFARLFHELCQPIVISRIFFICYAEKQTNRKAIQEMIGG